MDLSNLLCGLTALDPEGKRRKREALLFAFERWKDVEPACALADFIRRTPASLLGQTFGSPANDYYVTALISCAAQTSRPLDTVGASVLNRIVLQLNFQTRFIRSGGSPEILVLDGAPELFLPAMANGNVVFGFQVSADPNPRLPDWIGCSHIDLSLGALFWRNLEDFPALMAAVLRDRIGCLALNLPHSQAPSEIRTVERYGHLIEHFQEDSFFLLMADARTVLSAAGDLERAEPDARIQLRVYDHDNGERRAIMVASQLSRLPELTLHNAHT